MSALVVCSGGGFGDVLLATPVMRALRAHHERVIALTTPAHREVLRDNPDLAEVWVDEGDLQTVARRIAAERFDVAVVTWATLRTALLPWLGGIRVRVGQARRLYSRLFTHRVVVRSELGDRTTHWTQILLDYAREIGCDTSDTVPCFAVNDAARAEAEAVLAAEGVREPFVLFHPTRGIAGLAERWPMERMGALGKAVGAHLDARVVVSGTPGDRAIADRIAETAGGISLAGKTSLRALAAIAQRARCVVAMDSGPMHLAAAVGAPTVGIFALLTDEPDRWHPLGLRTAIVRNEYPCPSSHRKESCPDFACLRELETARVLAAIDRVL